MTRALASLPLVLALVAADGSPAPARAGIAALARRAAAALEAAAESPAVEAEDPPWSGDVLTDVRDVRACLPIEGGAVIAATGGGLLLVRADGTARAPWTSLDGLPETRVHALLREGERLWIGTEGGLAAATLRGDDLSIEKTVASRPVRAIVRHEGALFAATWGEGLVRVDERRGRIVPVHGAGPRLAGALAVHEGALFAGGPSGLYRLEGGKVVPVAGAPTSIWALGAHEGRLWLGSLTGLASLAGGKLRTESDADVRALLPDAGTLLAGTFGQGAVEVRDGRLRALAGLGGKAFLQAMGARGATRRGSSFSAAPAPAGRRFARPGSPRTTSPRWLPTATGSGSGPSTGASP
jgi:hypothetical protein